MRIPLLYTLFLIPLLSLTALGGATSTTATAKAPDGPSDADRWDLTGLYPNAAAWHAAMDAFKKRLPELDACRNHLGDSADNLKKCLDLDFALQLQLARLDTWAELTRAGDQLPQQNSEQATLAQDMAAKFGEASAFISPELVHLGRTKVAQLQGQSKELDRYKQFLRIVMDQADHTLDTGREELIASFGPILWSGSEIQQLLLNSDIEWKKVKFSDGKTEGVDVTVYEKRRQSADRGDRVKAFSAFYEVLGRYQRTLGANLANAIKRNVISAKAHKFSSALNAALDSEKIPEEVYRTLIKQVNEGLPVFQAYWKMKKQRLGITKLEYVDSYAPAGGKSEPFSIQKAKDVILAALAPLGEDYHSKISKAFGERWMDVFPRKGKNPGGFMNGSAYEVHPYLLFNHQNEFFSVSTMAHEWGHAMHSVYTMQTQPFVDSNYSNFIAEIASTTNEVLLHDYLIRNAKTPKEKAFYLESLLQLIKGTFFRQTQFAEFELRLHEEVEKGAALSGQKISAIYGEIAQRYYGDKEGVMKVDPQYFSEWAFVPHFYGGFAVYEYATSISAGFYFAQQILDKKPGALDNYLKVLKAGGSKYPYEILLDAGVDMKSPEVYRAIVARMKDATDQLKAIRN